MQEKNGYVIKFFCDKEHFNPFKVIASIIDYRNIKEIVSEFKHFSWHHTEYNGYHEFKKGKYVAIIYKDERPQSLNEILSMQKYQTA